MDLTHFVSFALALGLSLHFSSVLMRVAPKLGLVDQPGGRKDHKGEIPLVGGLAIFLGFVFALLALPDPLSGLRAFLAGCALVLIVGVLDDLHELSSASRFAVQIIAAGLMVYQGDVRLNDLGHLVDADSAVLLDGWSLPLTVFAVVGVINALNMIDGVDGLAGSLAAVTLGGLLVLATAAGQVQAASVMWLLLLSVAGFLVLNLRFPWQPRARIFLGDGGSMFLGFALAWFLVGLSQGEDRALSPVVALWLFAVPLIDTVTQMIRRVLQRRSPFAPDREHAHHLLLRIGLNPVQTWLLLVLVAVACAILGLIGHWLDWPQPLLFFGFLGLFAAYGLASHLFWRRQRVAGVALQRQPVAGPTQGSGQEDQPGPLSADRDEESGSTKAR